METYGDIIWGTVANTSMNTIEMPPEITRMTDRSIDNIKIYPFTILKNKNVDQNTYVNLEDTSNFVNPTNNVVTSYVSVCNDILTVSLPVTTLLPICDACNTAILQSSTFSGHTDRLSGVIRIGTVESDPNDPWLLPAAEVGRSLEYLNYISTGERNNVEFQNVFSSVFQSTITQLENEVSNLSNLSSTISSSIIEGEGGPVSSLTIQDISDIANSILVPASTMATRQAADKSLYGSSISSTDISQRSTVYNVISNTHTQIFNTIQSNMKY